MTDAAGGVNTLASPPTATWPRSPTPSASEEYLRLVWGRQPLLGYQNARGFKTTFAYAELPRRTSGLASITDARGGVYTFAYDEDGRLKTLIDQLGYRASSELVSGGQRNPCGRSSRRGRLITTTVLTVKSRRVTDATGRDGGTPHTTIAAKIRFGREIRLAGARR